MNPPERPGAWDRAAPPSDGPDSWPPDAPVSAAVAPVRTVPAVTLEGVLQTVRDHLARHIYPLDARDLDLLALWAAHTHALDVTYTTPRLLLTSPLPESGKTTVLEHLERLCLHPLSMSSAGSPALFARVLSAGQRTLMIDEADRNLRPDKPDVADVLAILNSGYKRGGVRPVLMPNKAGGFEAHEMPTFAPFAYAGIVPDLPDDTASRQIVVTMMPDLTGVIEESDWERIDAPTRELGRALAGAVSASVSRAVDPDPHLPDGCRGRMREKWRPLMRVAVAAGGTWPARCVELVARDIEHREADREDGLMKTRAELALLQDIVAEWPPGMAHWRTENIRDALVTRHADRWGPTERFGTGLTSQRIGRYLGKTLGVRTVKVSVAGRDQRVYLHEDVLRVARRLGLAPLEVTAGTVLTGQTALLPNRSGRTPA